MIDMGRISRRAMMASVGTGGAATALAASRTVVPGLKPQPFRFCLNTGTLRGFKLPLDQQLPLIAKAGYQAVEPWVSELTDYTKAGRPLRDLRKRMADLGLTVESAIGFSKWIAEEEKVRAEGIEQLKREMDLLSQLGATRIAAPPAGATGEPEIHLKKAAERYRAILELGDSFGIVPLLELWGFSRNLGRLADVLSVLLECSHPKAGLIADVYHLYKGGSGFEGLRLLSAGYMPVFHLNDYPAQPEREKISDADRVFPGDGVAPLSSILNSLRASGGGQVLSLELFNRSYWQKDVRWVLATGIEKMKAAVRRP